MIEYILLILLLGVSVLLWRQLRQVKQKLKELQSGKQSLSTRYGQIFEQLVPFSANFPGDPKRFRFIGDPVDGVLFDDDRIVFLEIKLNNSTLNDRQKKIRELVRTKKVEWKEIQGR